MPKKEKITKIFKNTIYINELLRKKKYHGISKECFISSF